MTNIPFPGKRILAFLSTSGISYLLVTLGFFLGDEGFVPIGQIGLTLYTSYLCLVERRDIRDRGRDSSFFDFFIWLYVPFMFLSFIAPRFFSFLTLVSILIGGVLFCFAYAAWEAIIFLLRRYFAAKTPNSLD